ncbi:MAG: hypothetical protein ACP5C3_06590 [Methanomicrobiales archaeon]
MINLIITIFGALLIIAGIYAMTFGFGTPPNFLFFFLGLCCAVLGFMLLIIFGSNVDLSELRKPKTKTTVKPVKKTSRGSTKSAERVKQVIQSKNKAKPEIKPVKKVYKEPEKPAEIKPQKIEKKPEKPVEIKPQKVEKSLEKPVEIKPQKVEKSLEKPVEIKPQKVEKSLEKPGEIKPQKVKKEDQSIIEKTDKELEKPAEKIREKTKKESIVDLIKKRQAEKSKQEKSESEGKSFVEDIEPVKPEDKPVPAEDESKKVPKEEPDKEKLKPITPVPKTDLDKDDKHYVKERLDKLKQDYIENVADVEDLIEERLESFRGTLNKIKSESKEPNIIWSFDAADVQDAMKETILKAENKIIMMYPWVRNIDVGILKKFMDTESKMIIQEASLDDDASVELIKVLQDNNVEIKTMPHVHTVAVVSDESNGLIISTDPIYESFEVGVIYKDENSISEIEKLFGEAWELSNDVKLEELD